MRLRTITGEPANPYQGGVIASTVKAVALCGGALVIVQAASAGGHHEGVAAPVVPVGRFLLVSFVITGGVQHFIYAPFVATLVPAWISPSQLFWTYLGGTALILGGAGIVIPLTTYVAAMLTGVMIFLWVPLRHIVGALADLHNANETTALFEALAMSGIAFMIASLRRDHLAAHRPYSVAAHDRECHSRRWAQIPPPNPGGPGLRAHYHPSYVAISGTVRDGCRRDYSGKP